MLFSYKLSYGDVKVIINLTFVYLAISKCIKYDDVAINKKISINIAIEVKDPLYVNPDMQIPVAIIIDFTKLFMVDAVAIFVVNLERAFKKKIGIT